MPRPHQGYYRPGVDHAPIYRRCDACRVSTLRAEGRYIQTSPLRQIWVCDTCATTPKKAIREARANAR